MCYSYCNLTGFHFVACVRVSLIGSLGPLFYLLIYLFMVSVRFNYKVDGSSKWSIKNQKMVLLAWKLGILLSFKFKLLVGYLHGQFVEMCCLCCLGKAQE